MRRPPTVALSVFLGVWMLAVVVLLLAISPSPLHAQEEASRQTAVLPKAVEEAYARGDTARGKEILDDLIAENPGNIDLAVKALHRICLEEFLELLDADWGDIQMRRRLIQNHRGDLMKMRQALSAHIRGALLRELEYESQERKYPPINELRLYTAKSPLTGGREYYRFLIRESLVRRHNYPALTPRDEWPDEAPRRLVALRRAGFAAPDHPAVVEAYALLVLFRRQQGRYLEAVELMDELAAGCGNNLPWLLARAKFHHRVGSARAGELFRQLFRRIGASHVDDQMQEVWQQAQPYAHYVDGQRDAPPARSQGWLAQMEPDDEQQDWAMVLRGRLQGSEQRVDRLIRQTLGDNINLAYMHGKDGTGVAISSNVLDAHLKSLRAVQLAGLRQLQEASCRTDRRAADLGGNSQTELLRLFRRYPWAATAHRALRIYAQRELEAGHTQAARRAFHDLMEHATDPRLRSMAQVGLWLVAAQQRDPNELAAAFEGTADGEKFPWMGAEATAASIRRRLLKGMPETGAAHSHALPLATLKPQLLKIPAVPPWPQTGNRSTTCLDLLSIQPTGLNVMVSSRNILAWYDMHDTERPVWTELRRTTALDRSHGAIGLFRAVIDRERVYTRWGYRARASHLAAFDATTGRVLWGTAAIDPSKLEKSVPLGNPALSGGQLYEAYGRTERQGSLRTYLDLTCIDAKSGTLVWNSELVLDGSNPYHNDWSHGVCGDVLTVCDGAIYCSPGGGVILRCDARDGRMEWMQRYESESGRPHVNPQGSKPMVAGDVLICLLRNVNDVMGLDRETGRVLWKNSLVPLVEELGLFNDTLIVQGRWVIAALDVRTGRVRWFTALTEPSIGRAVRLGSSVYIRTRTQLHRFDVATGIEEEVRPWPKTDNPVSNFAIHGDRLYLLTNEPCGVDPYRPGQPLSAAAAATAPPLRLPLQPCWAIRGYEPKLFVPPEGTLPEGRALLYSSEIVKCVETTPRGGIAWQRFVGPWLQDVFFLDGRAILLLMHGGSRRLEALDLNMGHFAWKTELPATVHQYDRSGSLFFVTDHDRLVAVNLTSGNLLTRSTVPGLSGGIQAGFGGGKIQVICCTRSSDQPLVMYWLTCDPLTGQVAGAGEKLRGLGGDKDALILNSHLRNTAFGRQATYFTAQNRMIEKHRPETFRCDYKDRSVRMIRSHASIHQFDAPYLLMSIEPKKGDRLRTWVVLRDDDPSYEFSVQVENGWNVSIRHGWLIQTKGSRPHLLRVHDLQSRKELVSHAAEDAEYVNVLQDGLETLLVYNYRRNDKFRLTQYNLNSGSNGPTTEIPFPRGRKLKPSDVRVFRNMLFITNGESLQAWTTANGKK